MTERWTAVKGSSGSGDVPAAATWGLLAVFAVHDAEELATMHKWSAKQTEWLRERVPAQDCHQRRGIGAGEAALPRALTVPRGRCLRLVLGQCDVMKLGTWA